MGLDIHTDRIGTVGELIAAVEYLEGTPGIISNLPTGTPENDACKGQGILNWYRLNDVVLRSPGVADVKMLCEARGGWSCTELRRQRGIVGDKCGLSAATLDAMPVVKFATLAAGKSTAIASTKPAGATVSARMMDAYTEKPERAGWSAQQWADYLVCSKSAVGESRAWESLKLVKADDKIGKAKAKDKRKNSRTI